MTAAAAAGVIPRRLFSLWLQGEGAAPDLVRLCLDRWRALNPGWSIEVLDRAAARAVLADFALFDALPAQALSDVLRIELLSRHGGVWTDATVLPAAPLDDWLAADAGFAAFERPGPDRALSSWFLAASAGSVLASRWRWAVRAYWDRPRTLAAPDAFDLSRPGDAVAPGAGAEGPVYPYFWFHYLFGRLVETDPVCAAAWRAAQRLPAEDAHALQTLWAADTGAGAAAVAAAAARSPLQKLNWRAGCRMDLLRPGAGAGS